MEIEGTTVETKDGLYSSYGPVKNELIEDGDFDIKIESLDTFSMRRSPSNASRSSSVPHSLLTKTSIKDPPEYVFAMRKERCIIISMLLIVVILGPLVFRFCMGARTNRLGDYPAPWGGSLDNWEWFILVSIFLNMVGFIIRLLPAVCGKPATIESVKECSLEGTAVLCVCSPFCSEDDSMLIRNLLGRTCTMFSTVNGRHTVQGLYIDATMNERRWKGEANRKHIFLEWLKFVSTLIQICQKKPERVNGLNKTKSERGIMKHKSTSEFQVSFSDGDDQRRNRFNSWARYGEAVFDTALSNTAESGPKTFNRAVVMDMSNEVRIRSSTVVGPVCQSYKPTEPQSVEDGMSSNGKVESVTHSIVEIEPGDKVISQVMGDLDIDMEVVQPAVNFLNHWLREMKSNEKVHGYGDKTR
jgi:hypothetical protein